MHIGRATVVLGLLESSGTALTRRRNTNSGTVLSTRGGSLKGITQHKGATMADFIRDLDFYQLDEWLGPEEKMTRDAVRRFVQREVIPSIERHFANETFPLELVP